MFRFSPLTKYEAQSLSKPSDRVLNHIDHPRNVGRIDQADAVGRSSLDGRAPYTHLYLLVREDRVVDAKFQTFGCGFSIAACSVVTEMAKGCTMTECLRISADKVIESLGHVPEEKQFCVELAVKALHDAVRKWSDKSTNPTP